MYEREEYFNLVEHILGNNALDEDTACRACINRLYYCLFNELLDLRPDLRQMNPLYSGGSHENTINRFCDILKRQNPEYTRLIKIIKKDLETMSNYRKNSDYYKNNADLDKCINKKGVATLKDMTMRILKNIDRVLE